MLLIKASTLLWATAAALIGCVDAAPIESRQWSRGRMTIGYRTVSRVRYPNRLINERERELILGIHRNKQRNTIRAAESPLIRLERWAIKSVSVCTLHRAQASGLVTPETGLYPAVKHIACSTSGRSC